MAIVLGNNPKSFKKPLKLVTIEGVEDTVIFEFKYRTRQEFAALMDARSAQDKQRAEAIKNAPVEIDKAGAPVDVQEKSFEAQMLEALDHGVERVMEVAQGWSLSEPFTKENLSILEGMYPTVLGQIQDLYQASVLEGRKKN